MNERSTPIAYRPEIDGLRAIAVVSVVLFHAELACPGGFVGVDIFFVISGYLIGSIISRQIAAQEFSFTEFWARRIRRIFPALFATIAGVLAIGYCVLDIPTLKQLGTSTLWQSMMLANVFFAQEVDYFGMASNYQPLLHTWSLAVEEQFYVALPIVLVLLARFTNRVRIIVLGSVFVVSLGLSWFCSGLYSSFAFYLLPCRMWELLAGVLLAIAPCRELPRRVSSVLCAAGLVLIGVAFVTLTDSRSFPGIEAAIPVLGATAVIAFGDPEKQWITSIVASRVPVFVGRVSYSFYLWHWPLLAIGRGALSDFGPATRLTIVVVSFIIAVIQWRFIEQPFRTHWRHRSVMTIAVGAVVMVAFASVGLGLQESDRPGLLSRRVTADVEDGIQWAGNEYHHAVDDQTCRYSSSLLIDAHKAEWQSGSKAILVWGDSHGMVLGDLLEDLGDRFEIPVHMAVGGGQLPLPPVGLDGQLLADDCVADAIFHYVADNNISDVILVARWSYYHLGERIEGLNSSNGGVAELDDMKRRLRVLASYFKDMGITVWVMLETPDTGESSVAAKQARAIALPGFNRGPTRTRSRQDYAERQGQFAEVVRKLGNELRVIDHLDDCYNEQGQTMNVLDDKAVYRDDDHLTRFGALQLVGPAMSNVFEDIAGR